MGVRLNRVVPFNPLDKANLASSVGNALSDSEPVSLGDLKEFEGSGIYALYYVGDFYAYGPLSKMVRAGEEIPIYVGKADSKGRRKGGFLEGASMGKSLFKRLSDHKKSISQAVNLNLEDFYCRYLVVDDLWIPLGESLFISRHSPVWNVLVDGFGNHDPGKGRLKGKKPLWDTLHPGRPWADRLVDSERSADDIGMEALRFLKDKYEVKPERRDYSLLVIE